MMTALSRLYDASVILGHLDTTGLPGVEGPGFKVLIANAVELVATDPDASACRAEAAARELDERDALTHMRRALAELADSSESR